MPIKNAPILSSFSEHGMQNKEVEKKISDLNKKFSTDKKLVNNTSVKLSVPEYIDYLTFLIIYSFKDGNSTAQSAGAKLFPLHNSWSKLNENNRRPIAVIACSKIFESAMFNLVYVYSEKLTVFYNRSTVNALKKLDTKSKIVLWTLFS